MKLKEKTEERPFKSEVVNRPWGLYGLYSDNKKSTTKILYIKKGEMLSMQYHFLRDQFYLVLDDDFTITYSTNKVPKHILNELDEQKRFLELEKFLKDNLVTMQANEGDMFGFKRCVVHRAQYNGNREYGRVLDVAFGVNDEEDITRVDDKYGRLEKN